MNRTKRENAVYQAVELVRQDITIAEASRRTGASYIAISSLCKKLGIEYSKLGRSEKALAHMYANKEVTVLQASIAFGICTQVIYNVGGDKLRAHLKTQKARRAALRDNQVASALANKGPVRNCQFNIWLSEPELESIRNYSKRSEKSVSGIFREGAALIILAKDEMPQRKTAGWLTFDAPSAERININ